MKKLTLSIKLQLALLIIITFVAYLKIFQNEFTVDDLDLILNWPEIRNFSNIGYLLKGNIIPGHNSVYRPISSLLYLVYYHFFGTTPFYYHLHSMIVHLLSVIFLYFIVLNLTKERLLSFFSALIFGVHPLTVEAIAYVSASIDSTGWCLLLASFLIYLKFKQNKKSRIL